MKKTCFCILFGFFLVMNCTAAQAISIEFTPSDSSMSLGSSLSVELVISGLGDQSLSAFDIDILFDPTIIAFSTVTFGNQLNLSGLGSISSATPGDGILNLFELSFDDPSYLDAFQANSFTLATIAFSAVVTGTSGLDLSLNALGNSNGNSLAASLSSGSVTVAAPVPEPSTLLLLASGLAGLVGFRRRFVASPQTIG